MKLKYSYTPPEGARFARAYGKELRISTKKAVEVCAAIRGMMLEDAKRFLQEVIEFKRPVPFRRHIRKIPHRKGKGIMAGRYPVKVAKAILKVLENLEANAEYKGLDKSRLKIVHIAAHKGRVLKRWYPRAFGRAFPIRRPTTNIEVVAEEV